MTCVDFIFLTCSVIWWKLSEIGGDDAPLGGISTQVPIDTLEEQQYHSINDYRGVPWSSRQDHA